MLAGATVFMFLERDNEVEERKKYNDSLNLFRQKYPQINETDLQILLNAHTEAESAGFIGNKRPRWDFSGAFYFVGTVVSTIGKLLFLYAGLYNVLFEVSVIIMFDI